MAFERLKQGLAAWTPQEGLTRATRKLLPSVLSVVATLGCANKVPEGTRPPDGQVSAETEGGVSLGNGGGSVETQREGETQGPRLLSEAEIKAMLPRATAALTPPPQSAVVKANRAARTDAYAQSQTEEDPMDPTQKEEVRHRIYGASPLTELVGNQTWIEWLNENLYSEAILETMKDPQVREEIKPLKLRKGLKTAEADRVDPIDVLLWELEQRKKDFIALVGQHFPEKVEQLNKEWERIEDREVIDRETEAQEKVASLQDFIPNFLSLYALNLTQYYTGEGNKIRVPKEELQNYPGGSVLAFNPCEESGFRSGKTDSQGVLFFVTPEGELYSADQGVNCGPYETFFVSAESPSPTSVPRAEAEEEKEEGDREDKFPRKVVPFIGLEGGVTPMSPLGGLQNAPGHPMTGYPIALEAGVILDDAFAVWGSAGVQLVGGWPSSFEGALGKREAMAASLGFGGKAYMRSVFQPKEERNQPVFDIALGTEFSGLIGPEFRPGWKWNFVQLEPLFWLGKEHRAALSLTLSGQWAHNPTKHGIPDDQDLERSESDFVDTMGIQVLGGLTIPIEVKKKK